MEWRDRKFKMVCNETCGYSRLCDLEGHREVVFCTVSAGFKLKGETCTGPWESGRDAFLRRPR